MKRAVDLEWDVVAAHYKAAFKVALAQAKESFRGIDANEPIPLRGVEHSEYGVAMVEILFRDAASAGTQAKLLGTQAVKELE